jgi:hypothetical protein
MNKILLFFIVLAFSAPASAQDFTYGDISAEAVNMKKYEKDTSAHAVVLQEFGESRINTNSRDELRLFFYYHVKIKILDNKGYSKGNIEIPVYTGDGNTYEEVSDIKATTFYADNNGLLQKAEVDPKNIFNVKRDKHWNIIKFAMPALKKGGIIEYSYRLESPYYYETFRSWEFQDDIPKVYSEYEVHIPAYYAYKASLRGGRKLTKSLGVAEPDCIDIRGVKNACSKITYGMSDIPAFVEEDYMTSPKNFLSAISFELEEFTNPYTMVKTKVTKDWKDIDQQLKTTDEFGGQLKKRDLFKDKLKEIIAGKDELEKAKAVYSYLQKWFKWNDFNGIYSVDGVKTAVSSHSGSIADINLALVATLNDAGIPTEAVILSTRNHGDINMLYPGIGDFNYVIAKANIGDKSYLLDASDPLLGFGILPLKCLNDKGRAFSLNKPSYWIDLNTSKQRENEIYNFDLALQENGKIKGTITHYSLSYSAYEARKAIKKFNSFDEYAENLDEKLPKLKITKASVENLDSLNAPLSEKFEVEIDAYNQLGKGNYIFDPYFFNKVTVNPFKLPERDYPIDWGMPSDDRYNVVLHLPAQYAVETPPKNVGVTLPNSAGRFVTDFQADDSSFSFSYNTQFTKSVYDQAEYPALKEFYNRIIATEQNSITIKKKQ